LSPLKSSLFWQKVLEVIFPKEISKKPGSRKSFLMLALLKPLILDGFKAKVIDLRQNAGFWLPLGGNFLEKMSFTFF
jgi:hypothetical protein